MTVSGRGWFKIGWGLAWGGAALAVQFLVRNDVGNSSTTVAASASQPLLSEAARIWALCAACALAPGLGSYLATSGTSTGGRARVRVSLVWAAIGLAVVAANRYLASHPLTADHNPWTVHLAVTLPVAGVLGGLFQCLATTAAAGARRLTHALVWMTLWGATFLLMRYVGVILVYLSYGAVTDFFEAAGSSALAGTVVGTFLGGYLTGHIAGAILARSPGIPWTSPRPA